jgi:hypothetical protein
VFIDGRTELYGNEFFSEYLGTYKVTADWQRPLHEYNVDYVLVDTISPLATLLDTHNEWLATYQDDIATIYVKTN